VDEVRIGAHRFPTPIVWTRVLVFGLLLALTVGAAAACHRVDEPTSGGSGVDGTRLSLICGHPGEGSVLAYLPPGSYRFSPTGTYAIQPGAYTLSPTGRYLMMTERREEEPAQMYYRPAVYDIGRLLEADPPPSPGELVPSSPDLWVRNDIWFYGWVLGDQALAIGDSHRVVLWWPETGETKTILGHPAGEAGEFAHHGGAVSPDGRSIALAESGPDGMIRLEQVLLQASAGSIEVEAVVTLVAELEGRTRYPGAPGFPYERVWLTWAPDCLSLAVSVERREGEYDLGSWFWEAFLLRLDTEPSAGPLLARDVSVFSWSPDGDYLIVEPTRDNQSSRVISPSGETILPMQSRNWSWVQGGEGLLAYEDGWSLVISVPDGTKEPLVWGNAIARLPDGRWLWLAPTLELPRDVDPDQTVTFYDNGAYREATLSEIAGLVSEVAADPRAKLGPGWYRSPGYAARCFTLDLLGIADWRNDEWSQCASGPGNVISDEAGGVYLGVYVGLLGPDDEAETTTVTLKTAKKTAYLISLARAWPGGPWLVVKVEPAQYVEGP